LWIKAYSSVCHSSCVCRRERVSGFAQYERKPCNLHLFRNRDEGAQPWLLSKPLPLHSAVVAKASILFLFFKSSDILNILKYYHARFIPVVQETNFNESINVIIYIKNKGEKSIVISIAVRNYTTLPTKKINFSKLEDTW
jgi:hypothetical protein